MISLPKDNWLICYCDGPQCDLSELLAYQLMELGFEKVAIYHEGIEGWIKANKAVEKGVE